MIKKKSGATVQFKILCIHCGVTIRESARNEAYGMCLKCFYRTLAARLRAQKRVTAGEFVSDR